MDMGTKTLRTFEVQSMTIKARWRGVVREHLKVPSSNILGLEAK